MEGFREYDETVPVFTLADLSKMYGLYARILGNLGVDQAARVHATRLSEKLESEILDLTSYKQGRDIILAFDRHIWRTSLILVGTRHRSILVPGAGIFVSRF